MAFEYGYICIEEKMLSFRTAISNDNLNAQGCGGLQSQR